MNELDPKALEAAAKRLSLKGGLGYEAHEFLDNVIVFLAALPSPPGADNAQVAPAPVVSVPEGMALVPQTALDWLYGSGPDANGEWFGEAEQQVQPLASLNGHTPRYWWRGHFRKLIEAAAQVALAEPAEAFDREAFLMSDDSLPSRLAAEPAEGEAVKPLEWLADGEDGDIKAEAVTGWYRVRYDKNDLPFAWALSHRWNTIKAFLTSDEAKAAAQVDYTQRIMSAIDAQVAPADHIAEKMVAPGNYPEIPDSSKSMAGPVTEGMVEAFMAELQAQGVAFDDFSPPIYPAKIISAVLAIADNTPPAPAEPAEGEAVPEITGFERNAVSRELASVTVWNDETKTIARFVPATPNREAATREAVIQAAIDELEKSKRQYSSQAKFADVEPAAYFRDFLQHIERALRALAQQAKPQQDGP